MELAPNCSEKRIEFADDLPFHGYFFAAKPFGSQAIVRENSSMATLRKDEACILAHFSGELPQKRSRKVVSAKGE